MIALIITKDGNTRLHQLPDDTRNFTEFRRTQTHQNWDDALKPLTEFDPFDSSVETIQIPLVSWFVDDRKVIYGIFEEPYTEESFFMELAR